jgi:hypothetical protein
VEEENTSSASLSAKKTLSCIFILKKNIKSFKKQLNFDDNIDLRLLIDYNMLNTPTPIIKACKDNNMSPEIKRI